MLKVLKRYAARFWSHVERRGPDECWLWAGAAAKKTGYGVFAAPLLGGALLAHRFAWMLAHNEILTGGVVRQRCQVRICVNPEHLVKHLDGRVHDYALLCEAYFRLGTLAAAAREHGATSATVAQAVRTCGRSVRTPREAARRGPSHPFWTGGTTQNQRGYMETSDGTLVHRQAGERLIGRALQGWETVHHIDEDKQNNADENLAVMPSREHSRFHTFLRHRGLSPSRETLLKFCARDGDYYFRFTSAMCELWAARLSTTTPIRKRSVRKCRVRSCETRSLARGLCSKHYQRKQARDRGFWKAGQGRRAAYTEKRMK